MDGQLRNAFTARDVADAVFSSTRMRAEYSHTGAAFIPQRHTVNELLDSIDHGLKEAGLSFAEYLERLRQAHERDSHLEHPVKQRWRFSSRERAVQRVDSAVAHLCALMQPVE